MKIRLLGDPGVGKSALIRAASHQPFLDIYVPHNNANRPLYDAQRTTIALPLTGEKIENVLLDAGGTPSDRSAPDAVLLVFSLDDPDSFKNIHKGYLETMPPDQNPVVFVIGCRSNPNKKSDSMYREIAESFDRQYWEVNAETGDNVDLLFQHVATCVRNRDYRRQTTSAFLKRVEETKAETIKKNYEHIINKLNLKHEEAYQNLAQLAADIPLINSVTVTMDDKPHHKERRDFRIALVKTLQKRYYRLLNEWDDAAKINRDIEALKTIERELHIIQAKASQKNKPKAAMHEVKKLIEELTKHLKTVEEKNALNALEENDPVRTMLFLAKTNSLPNKETLRILVEKHFIHPMVNQPKTQADISEAMKKLSEEEKTQLKKQLIQATQYEIHDSTNQPTKTYQTLYNDKDKLDSNIPLIAVLCTSGSGRANIKTNNYTTWLTQMNQSQKKSTKDKSLASTIAEIGLLGTAKRALTTRKEIKQHKKMDNDLFPLSFEGDKPKSKKPN